MKHEHPPEHDPAAEEQVSRLPTKHTWSPDPSTVPEPEHADRDDRGRAATSDNPDSTATYLLMGLVYVVAVAYTVIGLLIVVAALGFTGGSDPSIPAVLITLATLWTLLVVCTRRAVRRLRRGEYGYWVMLIPFALELGVAGSVVAFLASVS